jgi:hypothetical protein
MLYIAARMRSRFINFSFGRLQQYFGVPERAELWTAASLFVLTVLSKIWNVFLYQFDSDESQHLHVIWAWTRGLVQYRDVFDNHMPFFHLVCAPLLGLLGEHPADLYWMRLVMVPLYFLSAWSLYRIGAIAFSRRIGLWAALLVSGISVYQFSATEFRTDNLWSLLWFLCLLEIVADPFTLRSFTVGGLLLGLCFAVSMKTTLMLTAILLAMGIAIALIGWRRLALTPRRLGTGAAAFITYAAIVPLVVIAFFAASGVWSQFQSCVFTHNLEPARRNTYLNLLVLVPGLPILIYATRRLIKKETNPIVAFRRAFLCIGCGAYFLLMRGAWPHVTRQNYLPFFPLLALIAVAVLFKLSEKLRERNFMPHLLSRFSLPGVVATLVMFLDLVPRLPSTNEAATEVNVVRDVLALTNADDYVFDCKGETVFRRRCVPYVFETITLGRIERGEIAYDIGRCLETHTRVAVIGGEIPKEDETFIEINYLPVGHDVRVAGRLLKPPSTANEVIHFQISMPDQYEIVTPNGAAVGVLDGTSFEGARHLGAGEHGFQPATLGSPLAVLWAQAAERHFNPFSPSANAHPVRAAQTHQTLFRPIHIFGPWSL